MHARCGFLARLCSSVFVYTPAVNSLDVCDAFYLVFCVCWLLLSPSTKSTELQGLPVILNWPFLFCYISVLYKKSICQFLKLFQNTSIRLIIDEVSKSSDKKDFIKSKWKILTSLTLRGILFTLWLIALRLIEMDISPFTACDTFLFFVASSRSCSSAARLLAYSITFIAVREANSSKLISK